MAAVSSALDSIKVQEQSDDEPYSPNTRDTSTPDLHEDDKHDDKTYSSSFSIHNVLKKERESNSPENVFSTDKLLQNTPNFEESIDSLRQSANTSPIDDDDGRAEISVGDDNSCCSDDTVLSVGNEAPMSSYEEKSQENIQGLTTFKHIQTHLNTISQLSQNINISQPLLLRPNPITPNPLMFLNQPLIFQNPLMGQDLKLNMGNRLTSPQNLTPNFGMNFGLRKNEMKNSRVDENRRLYVPQKSDERDFINQNCLKFSIDNILKADFGRRITDPLNKRKTKARFESKVSPTKETVPKPDVIESRIPEVKSSEKIGAIDLSKADDSGSNQSSASGKFMNLFHRPYSFWRGKTSLKSSDLS